MPLAFFMEYIWNRFTGKVSPHFRSDARPTKSNLILADFTSIGIQVHRKKKKKKNEEEKWKIKLIELLSETSVVINATATEIWSILQKGKTDTFP